VGSDDVRDTPAAKVIAELNRAGYYRILAYDPVAMEEFKKHYQLGCDCVSDYDELMRKADVLAITTAWPEFKDIRTRTNKPVADCRYML